MPIEEVLDLLACPVCSADFAPAERTLRCRHGHSFDLARQGYANLLGRAAPANADSAVMVAARDRLLATGCYRPLADRIADLLERQLTPAAEDREPGSRQRAVGSRPAVLDAGAGTGYYLAAVLDRVPGSRGIALDLSVPAVRRAARAHPRSGAVVADTWRGLPLADRSLAAVMSVFAPRNATEFARTLRADGLLLVLSAALDHLGELRGPLGLLDVQPDKPDRLRAGLAPLFAPIGEEALRYRVALNPPALADLVGMGPNAFHTDAATIAERAAELGPTEVTVSVRLTRFRLC